MEHPYGSYIGNRHLPLGQIIADIERQAQTLGDAFGCILKPDLDWFRRTYRLCPDWVEKFFVTVPWQTIAPTYVEAVIAMLRVLKRSRSGALVNCLEGKLTSENFREYAPTAAAIKKLAQQQRSSSTLILPGQLGLRHRDRTAREVHEDMRSSEFVFGSFVNGTVLLTHPERGVSGSLWLCCAGDEYDEPVSDDLFDFTPVFSVSKGVVVFDSYWFDHARAYFGSASGFVPQV